jgi:hypothetical protein
MSIQVEVSVGEFLDKLAILEIKAERMTDPAKLANVRRELATLRSIWQGSPYLRLDLAAERLALKGINERLWDIEDEIRDKERARTFDTGFIELARSVYLCNDRRAEIKKAINAATGSALIEEKSYREYR